jgi:hypothetical protein
MRLRLSSSRLLRDSSPQGWPSIQPHLPLDFFLVGLLFPVVGLTAGALGLIFLAITLPCHAFFGEHIFTHMQDLQPPAAVHCHPAPLLSCWERTRAGNGNARLFSFNPSSGTGDRRSSKER